ncbi:MAG: hypothetical protein ACRDLR_03275, partial [Gaiellaceae bacterium]
ISNSSRIASSLASMRISITLRSKKSSRRAAAPFRHAGHHDAARVGDVTAALADQRHAPLSLGGSLIVVDTTNFAAVDLDAVVADARELIERCSALRRTTSCLEVNS